MAMGRRKAAHLAHLDSLSRCAGVPRCAGEPIGLELCGRVGVDAARYLGGGWLSISSPKPRNPKPSQCSIKRSRSKHIGGQSRYRGYFAGNDIN